MAAIRLCLVGCGKICSVHLNALRSLQDTSVLVTSLVDTNRSAAESIREQLPPNSKDICKIYSNINEAHSNYDAAVLMVPHDLHVPLASECIKEGKHVLLEKPVATTFEGCKQLEQLASNTDKVFMIGENSVYWPEVVQSLDLINNDVIGEPYYVQANYWESIGHSDFNDGDVPCWKLDSDKAGGGVVIDGAIHWIRPLRLFLGEVNSLVSVLSHPWQSMINGESLAHAIIKFTSGKSGVLHCHVNNIPMERIPFFQIFGPKGEITIHGSFNGGMTIRTKNGNQSNSVETITTNHGGYFGAFGPQMSHFISCIKRGQGPLRSHDPSSVWEGTKDVYVAKAMYKSVQTESWERVEK